MLILTRAIGQSICIGNDTIITVAETWAEEAELEIETNQTVIIEPNKVVSTRDTSPPPACR